jgi:hypothetical protein
VNYRMDSLGSARLVSLGGFISEDSELAFQKITQELDGVSEVHFSFAEVKAINSLGVRAWVTFLRSVEPNRQVHFRECVPEIIMQINMIPSFQGLAHIDSFFVNYVSPTTEKTYRFLLNTAELPKNELPTAPLCPTSGVPMETEELEEEYFAFLSR